MRNFILFFLCFTALNTSAIKHSRDSLLNDSNTIQFKNHILGIQLNPWIGQKYPFQPGMNRYLLLGAFRYGYNYNPILVFGGEFSGTFQKYNKGLDYTTLGVGPWSQIWVFQRNRLRLGAEANVFATYRMYTINKDHHSPDRIEFYQNAWEQKFHIGYFVSPVVSFSGKDSPWSFDLLYKFTHREIPGYWNKAVFSYRICYHF